MVFLGIFTFANTAALIFLFNLIWFHIELRHRGLSTYEYLKIQSDTQGKESKIVLKLNEDFRKQLAVEFEIRRNLALEQQSLKEKLALM